MASGLDLGLSEMVETRGLDHIGQLNAAKMAENQSKRMWSESKSEKFETRISIMQYSERKINHKTLAYLIKQYLSSIPYKMRK